jgi:uncharacterized protein YndB with AHSA1/START domain
MKKTIKHQYYFSRSAETVWEYLTKSELMELWLMKNNFRPVAGADFEFRTGPIASLNFDGIFYCRVLEIEPFKKLSYSWQSGPGDKRIALDSVVEWRLQPTGEGTTLFLEHSGFAKPENDAFYKGLDHGWTEKLENIDNLLKAL